LASFFAYENTFTVGIRHNFFGGVHVGAVDVNGDGKAE